jgi:hypothetical protein
MQRRIADEFRSALIEFLYAAKTGSTTHAQRAALSSASAKAEQLPDDLCSALSKVHVLKRGMPTPHECRPLRVPFVRWTAVFILASSVYDLRALTQCDLGLRPASDGRPIGCDRRLEIIDPGHVLDDVVTSAVPHIDA